MAVLCLLFAVTTWNACSKDHSFEKNGNSVIDDLLPDDDSTNNNDDSTDDGEDDNNDDSTVDNEDDDSTALTDVSFMQKAAVINLAQLDNATLAADRGTAQSVRNFAEALLLRFRQAKADMDTLSINTRVAIPIEPDAAHQSVTDGLEDMEGRTFDVSYVDYQMQELQRAVDLYRAQIANGDDTRIKAYATKYLPYLEEFLLTASNIRQNL